MRVYCYCVYVSNGRSQRLWDAIQDQGWISSTADPEIIYYWIPEDLRAWCVLIDPTMRRLSEHDTYV
jgi:hypothetical protein